MVRNSVAFKIIISVVITIALVLSLCTYYLVKIQTTEMIEHTKKSNASVSKVIYKYIENVMLSGNADKVQSLLIDMRNIGDVIEATVANSKGVIIYSSEKDKIGLTDAYLAKVYDKNISGLGDRKGLDVWRTTVPVLNKSSCQKCHSSDGEILGTLQLDLSLASTYDIIRNNRNVVVIFSITTILLVCLVIGFIVIKIINKPIKHLIHTMKKARAGDLHVRSEIHSNDELEILAASFNKMIKSLEEADKELREYHDSQIRQADKLASIGELASGIAHEIKNPLAGISGVMQILSADKKIKEHPHYELIAEVMEQIKRLNKTVNDFLDFARPKEPELFENDINEILKKAVFLIRQQAQRQHIKILEHYDAGLDKISVDMQKIQQVFINILINALQVVKAKEGIIKISTTTEYKDDNKKYVKIEIEDNGPGIPQENIHQIFNPFFTTKHKGTGLGLSITKGIIKKHNGEIFVESEENSGAKFTIHLPVKSD